MWNPTTTTTSSDNQKQVELDDCKCSGNADAVSSASACLNVHQKQQQQQQHEFDQQKNNSKYEQQQTSLFGAQLTGPAAEQAENKEKLLEEAQQAAETIDSGFISGPQTQLSEIIVAEEQEGAKALPTTDKTSEDNNQQQKPQHKQLQEPNLDSGCIESEELEFSEQITSSDNNMPLKSNVDASLDARFCNLQIENAPREPPSATGATAKVKTNAAQQEPALEPWEKFYIQNEEGDT